MIAMQHLAEKYRPDTLKSVVGQPAIRPLLRFVQKPYPSCFILTGPPGTGKSSSALALAADLGATDPWSGLEVVSASDLGKDEVTRQLRRLWATSLFGGKPDGTWNILIIEELERLSQPAQVSLKVGLASENMPPRGIVVATSNDTSALDPALLERFGRPIEFKALGAFAHDGAARVAWVWAQETDGLPMPIGSERWGWQAEGKRYSLRAAMDCCQRALLETEVGV